VLSLPLDVVRLENEEARNAFVDAAAAFQMGVPMLTAPYFEIDVDEDTCVEVNVAMLPGSFCACATSDWSRRRRSS
jgi:hypothetical protein